MRLSWLGSGLALCGALASCSTSNEAPLTGGAGGQPPAPTDNATVRFDETGTLTLAPGEARQLGVVGAPAAPYRIAFSLLGAPLDGWVDPPEATADDTGHAFVELHAPSHATTFHVRASLLDAQGAPGAGVERAVAVSELGFASIAVAPVYAGHRPVTTWTASVAAGTTCAELSKTLPAEPGGALTATAPAGGEPVVDNAPVGPALAVLVRAGHFAWGCADTMATAPGETSTVSVNVIDKPLDLAGVTLGALFDFSADAPLLVPLFADAALALGDAFLPSGGGKDGSVILNSMAALVPASAAATFSTQRIDKGWDALAIQHFASLTPTLRERLELWAAAGLALQSPSFEAQLASGNPATLLVTRFGDLDGPAVGAGAPVPLTWSPQPKDTVLLSAGLVWEPTRLAGNAALAAAQQDVPGAAGVPDALAVAGDCAGLGAALGGFGSCDAGCVAQLCAAALGARFGAALGASLKAGQVGAIGVQASADATVGDAAQPQSLAGQWIGEFSDGTPLVTVSGALTAPAP
jgi:hypothetical protein